MFLHLKVKNGILQLYQLLPNTIWTDIYKKKSTYNNVEELYNLNSETREDLLYMIKFGHLKLFYGIVYSSGIGTFGRLGDGRTDWHEEGTPIPIDTANMQGKRVIQVSVGECHSLFLCEDSSVYASGIGMWGTPIQIDTYNINGKRETELTCQRKSIAFAKKLAFSNEPMGSCETDKVCHARGCGAAACRFLKE